MMCSELCKSLVSLAAARARVASILLILWFSSEVWAGFIQPDELTFSRTSTINTPDVLVGDVSSSTDSHPSPTSGGGGTSWWSDGNPVGQSLTFDFASTVNLESFHLWDYYSHSPDAYTLVLYDGPNATGGQLHSQAISINPGPDGQSTRHDFNFGTVNGVQSGRLTATQESSPGYPGYGLAEVGFNGTVVPEPRAWMLAALGFLAWIWCGRRA